MHDLVIPGKSTTVLQEAHQLVIPRESCQELSFHQSRVNKLWDLDILQ